MQKGKEKSEQKISTSNHIETENVLIKAESVN